MNARRLFPWIVAGMSLAASAAVAASQDAKAPTLPAVDVRVRVSAGGLFQDDLKIGDFQLLENGWPQSIASLALVQGGSVARREGGEPAESRIPRSYTLLFQAVDWDPKLTEAIDYLFAAILKPGDSLALITPIKPYRLGQDALSTRSKADLAGRMKDVLRKDILKGGGEYRNLLNDLRRLTGAIAGTTQGFQEDVESDASMSSASGFGLEMQIDRYRQTLTKLDNIRLVDEKKLVGFADSIQAVPGQKTVVLFYQREYRPEISEATMSILMSMYQDDHNMMANLMDLFQFYKRASAFNADRVKKAFSSAGLDFHFIFMEKRSQRIAGATMREQSEDIFPGFVELARATGGTAVNSPNPAAAFKGAIDASNDYYLLSYVPDLSSADGGFRTIEVRVARPGCEVMSRLGYFAK